MAMQYEDFLLTGCIVIGFKIKTIKSHYQKTNYSIINKQKNIISTPHHSKITKSNYK
jgi:hypothetical protein